MKKMRNGNIELLRFLFCADIVLYHAGFLPRGYVGAEFFFMVTGFFLADKILTRNSKDQRKPTWETLVGEATADIWKRYCAIFPYFFASTVLGFAVRAFALHWDLPTFLTYLQLIPADMLYLQNIGFTVTSAIGVLWYLSAMTFAVWVLYPLLRRRYELVASVSPAVILLILGLIQQNCGSLDAPCTFLYGWLNTGLLRAFAGILGGVLAYYVTQKVRGINITKGMAAALTVFEVAVYIWVFYHTWSRNDFRPLLDAFVIVALGGAFTVTVSGKSLLYQKFDNGFVRFLGKASMPIFLSHFYMVFYLSNVFEMLHMEDTFGQKLAFTIGLSLLAAAIVYAAGQLMCRLIKAWAVSFQNKLKAIN